MKIRFIDAGTVTGLRSQSIYHGLAYAQKTNTPNTIVLATPGTPYMCIGYFQDVENELDIDYCRKNQLPIIRRETGGGAVYIDDGQLFVQWIFQQSSLPKRVDQRFQLFVKPLIETYKFFGIDAYYHPINDVHVNGKKIVGTGAGTIGEAEVVTGNFLFNFNYETMVGAVNVPSQSFESLVSKNLGQYLTTIHKELADPPSRKEVIEEYIKECEKVLGLKTEEGGFTNEEMYQMLLVEEKFVREDWLYQTKKNTPVNKLFKVHLGVWIGQINLTVDGKVLQALITLKNDFIKEVKLAVEGQKQVDHALKQLEHELVGTLMDRDKIAQKVERVFNGELRNEWVECIFKMKELIRQQTGDGAMARSN